MEELNVQNNNNQINNQGYVPAKPNNYLALSIITTVMCCMPLGAFSIYQSSQVDGLYNQGKYQEAEAKSKSAKTWAIVGIAGMVIFFILYILSIVLLGVASNM